MNTHTLLLIILLSPLFAAAQHHSIDLTVTDAVLSDQHIAKFNTQKILNWQPGGSVHWTVTLADPLTLNLILNYSAWKNTSIQIDVLGLPTQTVPLIDTGLWNEPRDVGATTLTLPAGTHEIRLTNPEHKQFITLYSARLTTEKPPQAVVEYPAIYTQSADWPRSMTAMRTAFRQLDQSELPLYLNERDGRALWADFPHESDWFLQDNQVHGEWGTGRYDARQDYQYYLDPARDNTLERTLVSHVLQEIAAPKLSKELNTLIAANCSPDNPAWLKLYIKACITRRAQRLAPLLTETDHLVYATHHNMGTIYMCTAYQGSAPGSQLRLIDLRPLKEGLPLKDELLFDAEDGIVRDPELSFDGKKLLFAWRKTTKNVVSTGAIVPATGNYKIYEMDLATRAIRPLTTDETYGADYEPCYLPNGDILFTSTRCVHEVTCGWGDCGNIYVMNQDGHYARRLGFDQTRTGFQQVLNDGRVVYTRRDYNDRGQSFGHALFVMNPDGTTQTEYYGNNSFVPTSLQHTRPIPGTRKTMSIAGGYHTSQGGKLATIDPKKGRQNFEGISFHDWTPPALADISDENFSRVGDQYAYPYPFDESSLLISYNPLGGYLFNSEGKFIHKLEQRRMIYRLYYMTLDGQREMLAADPTLSCTQAIPVRPRKKPAVRASSVDYTKEMGTCYVQNVYYGPSADGIKPGSIKKLRVVQMHYKPITIGGGGWLPPLDQVGPGKKYASIGWHSVTPVGVGTTSFDAKTILGKVEVHADGSAMFEVPARTPVYFQLIDENGLVVQTMRSWATLMPNERFSCVGCHEENDSAPLPQAMKTMAMQQAPQKIQLVPAITGAPFSYVTRVQPIWNQHCISCHAPGKKAAKIDLTDTIVSDDVLETGRGSTRRKFYQSYLTLLQAKLTDRLQWTDDKMPDNRMRIDEGRPNEWVDYYTRLATVELTPPYYAGSTQSGLIKMLQNGHGKTKLSAEEIGTVAAWIDLNVPFIGEYDEMNIWDDKSKALYAEKLGMRHKQEQIEDENIKSYIQQGQP